MNADRVPTQLVHVLLEACLVRTTFNYLLQCLNIGQVVRPRVDAVLRVAAAGGRRGEGEESRRKLLDW